MNVGDSLGGRVPVSVVPVRDHPHQQWHVNESSFSNHPPVFTSSPPTNVS